MLADRVDLGLVSYPESSREITMLPWRREEMVVVASPYHPLADQDAILRRDEHQLGRFQGLGRRDRNAIRVDAVGLPVPIKTERRQDGHYSIIQ